MSDSLNSARPTTLRPQDQLRRAINFATGATPLGLALAQRGQASRRPGPDGTIIAANYRSRFPAPNAAAVTIGDVILLRLDEQQLQARPELIRHEVRHSVQWAWFLGLIGFPLAYGLASIWSMLTVGDAARGNFFERDANLMDGGYQPK